MPDLVILLIQAHRHLYSNFSDFFLQRGFVIIPNRILPALRFLKMDNRSPLSYPPFWAFMPEASNN